jgi:hypothetical protein
MNKYKLIASTAMGKRFIATLNDENNVENYPEELWFSGGNKNSNGNLNRSSENTFIVNGKSVLQGFVFFPENFRVFANISLKPANTFDTLTNTWTEKGWTTGNQIVECLITSMNGKTVTVFDPTKQTDKIRTISVKQNYFLSVEI